MYLSLSIKTRCENVQSRRVHLVAIHCVRALVHMISSISILFQGDPHTRVSMVYGGKHWTELLGGP